MPWLRRFGGAAVRRAAAAGDVWLAVVLAGAGTYFFSGQFTPVHFDQERITVQVNRSQLHVTGLYHYHNRSRLPAWLTLGVPFPVDADHPAPDDFFLSETGEDGRPLAPLPSARRGDEGRVRLFFRPGEEKWIRLDYTQPARVSSGRYLLTTTRAWRRPIAQASFTLRLPPGAELVSSNYVLTPEPAAGPRRTYTFSRTEFYPDQDWEFAWQEPRSAVARNRGDLP
ncbi:MAG: hypothetical protein ACRD4U_09680 [Candidatus Acidiferrales bacterium]